MTNVEGASDWKKEFFCASVSGILFGATNTITGHPLDTVKTKMQAQQSFSHKSSITGICKQLYAERGLMGFYPGWAPPLLGSMIFRSAQFSTYNMWHTAAKDNKLMLTQVPFTGGIELRVFAGGILSGTVRSLLECPFEYAKVKRQTGQAWVMGEVFKGYTMVWPRACGILSTYFLLMDTYKRHTTWL
jgi:solute carrier family 25 carnitine/acylcarnitine transporter 20/29